MNEIIKSEALSLKTAFEFDKYQDIFLIDVSVYSDDLDYIKVDLGNRRSIVVGNDCYLAFVSENEIIMESLQIPKSENPEFESYVKMIDCLSKYGIKAKNSNAKLKEVEESIRTGWFSNYGYCLQDSSWLDCLTYAFDMFLVKNHLLIGEKNINSISVTHSSWVNVDIMDVMENEIEKVLTECIQISETGFYEILEKKSMINTYKHFEIREY